MRARDRTKILWVLMAGVIWVIPASAGAGRPSVTRRLPVWTPGTLDIHHINTGRGNSTFIVAPDGTTILIDAGALNPAGIERKAAPLRLGPVVPGANRRPGEWITRYIRMVAPPDHKRLDYAIITHFHTDHFGDVTRASPWSRSRAYQLGGITDVGDALPIAVLIDRRQPGSGDPPPQPNATVRNYLAFADYLRTHSGTRVEPLRVGANDQIVLRSGAAYPSFHVLGVKAGSRVADGQGGARTAFDPRLAQGQDGAVAENPLSIALKISYGTFDYFTGGDNTGLDEPYAEKVVNTEVEIAPVVGAVDAMTLDHHGNRDATNSGFLSTLRPRVVVEQVYTTDQPGGEVLHRLASRVLYPGPRDIFLTRLFPETRIAIGPWIDAAVTASGGHVLIRVAPGGASYRVLMLDDRAQRPRVRAEFGPYVSQ